VEKPHGVAHDDDGGESTSRFEQHMICWHHALDGIESKVARGVFQRVDGRTVEVRGTRIA
jgi:hypothetical protein